MGETFIPFDAAKFCDCYSALDTSLGNESTFGWSDGASVSLSTNGSGGWTLSDGEGNTWTADSWDGTGCMNFTLTEGTGEATVSVCCDPCPAALSGPAFYEWNMAAQKWVKLMDRDPEPPANLKPGTFDGQIIEV